MHWFYLNLEAEKEKGRKEGGGLGVFYSQQHYVKLYEVLRGAYSNYKVSEMSSLSPISIPLCGKRRGLVSIVVFIWYCPFSLFSDFSRSDELGEVCPCSKRRSASFVADVGSCVSG